MQELFKFEEKELNNEKVNTINARDLWKYLESKQEFANWIKNRIENYKFEEGKDFCSFDRIIKRTKGATVQKEYYLSIDTAKEIAMIENNDKGREARQYFIEIEKRFKKVSEEFNKLSDDEKNRLRERYKNTINRKSLTDVIKEFVEYATNQGSQHAEMYYQNFTRMVNLELFFIKKATKFKEINKKGLRDFLNPQQITELTVTENMIRMRLEEYMKLGINYKEIYDKVRLQVIDLKKHLDTDIPRLLTSDEIEKSEPAIIESFYKNTIIPRLEQQRTSQIQENKQIGVKSE